MLKVITKTIQLQKNCMLNLKNEQKRLLFSYSFLERGKVLKIQCHQIWRQTLEIQNLYATVWIEAKCTNSRKCWKLLQRGWMFKKKKCLSMSKVSLCCWEKLLIYTMSFQAWHKKWMTTWMMVIFLRNSCLL